MQSFAARSHARKCHFRLLSAFSTALAMLLTILAPSLGSAQSAVWEPQGATSGNIYYNGGNVGVGTATPAQKLEVNGTMRLSGTSAVDMSNVSGALSISTGQTAAFRLVPWQNYLHIQNTASSGGFYFAGVGGTPLSGMVVFNTTGKMGIGTTNPQHKLSVNGTIGAKEVIVTNTGWSDYVFHPEYRLQPLAEVADFIKKHQHLPDIPSEAEVKEHGVSVGEIQVKLLAKVEELTLHLIQQEQENQQLRNRLLQLEKRVAEAMPNTAGHKEARESIQPGVPQ